MWEVDCLKAESSDSKEPARSLPLDLHIPLNDDKLRSGTGGMKSILRVMGLGC